MQAPQSRKPSVSVFFPVYKDEGTVEVMVQKSMEVLDSVASEYEILIINDCSPDRSGEIAEQLAQKHAQVRIIHHEQQKGYGAALRTGLANVQFEWICFTDGDDQYDIYDLHKLIRLREFYDLIITFRYVKIYSGFRIFVSGIYNMILRFLFKTTYRDISTGLRLARKSLIDELQLESEGPFIGAEIAIKSMLKGYRVGEVGIQSFPRKFGESSSTSWANIWLTLKEMWQMYQKVFSPYYDLPQNRKRS